MKKTYLLFFILLFSNFSHSQLMQANNSIIRSRYEFYIQTSPVSSDANRTIAISVSGMNNCSFYTNEIFFSKFNTSGTKVLTADGMGLLQSLPLSSFNYSDPDNTIVIDNASKTLKVNSDMVMMAQVANDSISSIKNSLSLKSDKSNTITINGNTQDFDGPILFTIPAGPKGDTGSQGIQGIKGDKGDTGIQGPAGNDGAVGPQGPIGITGPAGSVGPTGPAGTNGTNGTNATTTSVATTTVNGLMSFSDKSKLDTVAEEQRVITAVVGANGRATWTYPTAYGSGVVPVIQAQAVKPTSSTISYNCAIYGDPTNTSVTVEVNTVNPTILGILGSILIAQPAPAGTKVHIIAKAP